MLSAMAMLHNYNYYEIIMRRVDRRFDPREQALGNQP